MTHSSGNDRYLELYRYYADYFTQQAEQSGAPVDDAQRHEYATYYATQQLAAEAPPTAPAVPPVPAPPTEPTAQEQPPAAPAQSQPAPPQPEAQQPSVPQPGMQQPGTPQQDTQQPFPQQTTPQPNAPQPNAPQPNAIYRQPQDGSAAAGAFAAAGGPGQPYGAAPAKKKWSTTRKLLTFGLPALGVIAIAAAVILILPSLFGGASSQNTLRDYPSAPNKSWTYTVGGEYLDSPSVTAAGDNLAVVTTNFDSYSWRYDQPSSSSYYTWYDGFEDDYEAGYEAGLAYEEAYDNWLDDFSADYPDRDSYWTFSDDMYGDNGHSAGWEDASWGEYGENLVSEPVTPDVDVTATLLNLDSGDPVWEVNFADLVDDFDPTNTTVRAYDSSDASRVILATSTYDYSSDDPASSTLLTVSKSDASAVSSVALSGTINNVETVDGAIIVAYSNDDDETIVERLAIDNLTATPSWSLTVDSSTAWIAPVEGSSAIVIDGDDPIAVDAGTGEKTSWSSRLRNSMHVSDAFVNGSTIILQSYDSSYVTTLTAFNTNGDSLWSADDYDYAWRETESALIACESSSGSSSTYDCSRLNLQTGEQLWTVDDVDAPWGVLDNRWLISVDDDLAAYNLGNGEKVDVMLPALDYDDVDDLYLAQSQFIVQEDETFAAYRIGSADPIWTIDIDRDWDLDADSTWYLTQVNDRLVITIRAYDDDEMTIVGFAS